MSAQEQIIKTLKDAGKPLRPGDIVKISGLEKDDVSKAIKELKKNEKIYSPKRCYYDVKK